MRNKRLHKGSPSLRWVRAMPTTSTRLPAYFSVLRMIFRSPYTMTEITASAVSTSVTTVYISTICVSFMPHFSK